MPTAEDSENIPKSALKAVVRRLLHEPFLHLLLVAILGAVLWLIYTDKIEMVGPLLWVGGVAVLVTLLGVAAGWFAPRINAILEAIPQIRDFGERTTQNFEQLTLAFSVLSRFVSVTQAENARSNKLVLLVEDSTVDARLVRAMCADIVRDFHLVFRDVGSLGEAFTYLSQSCVAVIDVILPDNDSPAQINVLISLATCPVIVHSSTTYTPQDFPGAFAVLTKTNSLAELKEAIARAIASTRFPSQ